ncbi:MAG: 2-oxoglutarate ferredoxin oxidoreductase subunit alpha, partial [Bacteroidetes bacterium QH_2_63_10]
EAWRIPDTDALPAFDVEFETEKTERTIHEDQDGNDQFLPYVRDPETLARAWARPGTPDLEHRIGGLEKEHKTGNVSYEAENHQKMVELRAQKVQNVQQDIPPTRIHGASDGDLLVLGWGSTKGAIDEATERANEEGLRVGSVVLRHVWPLPSDLGAVLDRFDRVLVPELNNGQLIRVLRDQYPTRDFTPLNKIQGRPFRAEEIVDEIEALLGTPTPA